MDINVTIATIFLILILIIPGVIFKRFYFQGAFSKQFWAGPVGDRFYTSIFWGIIIQYITYFSFSKATGVDYNKFREYLQAPFIQLNNDELPTLSDPLLMYPLYYFLLSLFFAAVGGYGFFHIVRGTKLDIKSPIFRFSNKWNYYFSGEILYSNEFKSSNSPKKRITSTTVDVLVNYGEGKNTLFSGTFSQYDLHSNGDLETLYLTEIGRYKYIEGEVKPILRPIPGDCFVIPYKNVLNMNIQYLVDRSVVIELKWIEKKWVGKLFSFILLFTFLAILIIPWMTEVDIIRKFMGMILAFASYLFLISLFSESAKMNRGTLGMTFILAFSFFMMSLFLLDLQGILVEPFQWFIDWWSKIWN